MKVYESSALRPFGSLVSGVVTTSILLGLAWAVSVLVMYSGAGRWRPELIEKALTFPLFLGVAGVILLVNVPITLNAVGACRGSYRMTPTELEVWSGILHKTMVAVKYQSISDISLSQGPLMRLLGTYDLTIHHPGGCRGTWRTTLHGIRNGEGVRLSLLERMDSLREQKGFED